VYHYLDIALGTLKFAQAEHVSHVPDFASKSADILGYSIYRHNKKLYDIYAGAMGHFKSALSYAEKKANHHAKGKIFLNIAACQEKTGAYEDAYETLSRAETIANNYALHDLMWMAQFKLAEFLHRHGAEVEGVASRKMAREYYQKATEELLRCPQCHARHVHHAGMLFESFTRFLIDTGDWRSAFGVMEKGYALTRVMLVSLADRYFSDAAHREKFKARQKLVHDFIAARETCSTLLVSGESRDSEKVKSALKTIAAKESALRAGDAELQKDSSLFSTFLTVHVPEIAPIPGAVVLSFMEMEKKIGAWKLDGALSYSELPCEKKSDVGRIMREHISGSCRKNANCFVVLNNASISLVADTASDNQKRKQSFTFVPSFERAKYFVAQKTSVVPSAYGASKKLASLLRAEKAFAGAVVDEYKESGVDLSRYSILVGGSDEFSVEPQSLFVRKQSPGIYVGRASAHSYERIVMCVEASLYAGMRGLLIHNLTDETKLSKLISSTSEKPLAAVAGEVDGAFVLPIGRGLKD
jgi:tetratricopeptide (TPR) repeat protein